MLRRLLFRMLLLILILLWGMFNTMIVFGGEGRHILRHLLLLLPFTLTDPTTWEDQPDIILVDQRGSWRWREDNNKEEFRTITSTTTAVAIGA